MNQHQAKQLQLGARVYARYARGDWRPATVRHVIIETGHDKPVPNVGEVLAIQIIFDCEHRTRGGSHSVKPKDIRSGGVVELLGALAPPEDS